MIHKILHDKLNAFIDSRAENSIERHQIIVYLLHSSIVVSVIMMHLSGLGGSHDILPRSMSVIHLTTCLIALSLYLSRKLSVPVAFSLVAIVAQLSIVGRFVYFIQTKPENFLNLILINQMTSLLAVVFLVICFVRYTPFVITVISLVTYGISAAYLKDPNLWSLFGFFLAIEVLFCVLGELLHHNVSNVQKENANLHQRDTALMHAVRLNEREIEAYLRISNTDQLSPEDTDRLFSMLKPKSQRNLVNAVRLHLKKHLMDDCDLAHHFPCLTKSETDVCRLILAGKKRREISLLLGKTENNVDVTRNHIRKKLNVPTDQDLQKFLINLLIEKEYPNTEEINK